MLRNRWLSFVAATVFAFAGMPLSSWAKTFTILTGDWEPYVSSKLEGGGPLARIVSEAVEAGGHSARLLFVPWKRTEAEVTSGAALATFPWSANDAFRKSCYLSDPILRNRMVFFYLKDRLPGWDFTCVEQLKTLKVGGSPGYVYAELFEKAGIWPDYAPDIDKSLMKLFAGRVDLVPENEVVGWDTLRRLFPSQENRVASSKSALYEAPLHLMISNIHSDGGDLLEAFNAGLEKLKASGRYRDILESGGLTAGAL